MARPAAGRSLTLAALAALARADAGPTDAAPACFDLVAKIAPGFRTTRDQPMTVLWLEDADGRFVRTLWRFGKQTKWYKDLTVWHELSAPREREQDLDAVTGATIIQGDSARLRVPTRWRGLDLLSGRYVLRVETRKDHAKHYTAMRIPLGPRALGTTAEDPGYVRSLAVERRAEPAPAAPTAVAVDPAAGAPAADAPAR